jgi:hypothetical protein
MHGIGVGLGFGSKFVLFVFEVMDLLIMPTKLQNLNILNYKQI